MVIGLESNIRSFKDSVTKHCLPRYQRVTHIPQTDHFQCDHLFVSPTQHPTRILSLFPSLQGECWTWSNDTQFPNGHSFISSNLNKMPISELVLFSPAFWSSPDNDRDGLENKALSRPRRSLYSSNETFEMLICQQFIIEALIGTTVAGHKEFIGNYDISQRFKLVSLSLARSIVHLSPASHPVFCWPNQSQTGQMMLLSYFLIIHSEFCSFRIQQPLIRPKGEKKNSKKCKIRFAHLQSKSIAFEQRSEDRLELNIWLASLEQHAAGDWNLIIQITLIKLY